MPTKQRCNICGELKVLAEFPPGQKVHGVQRYKHTCLECLKVKQDKQLEVDKKIIEEIKQHAEALQHSDPDDYHEGYKVCTKCGEEKPISEFFKDRISNGRQTYRGECKLCSQAAAKSRIARYKSKKKVLEYTLTNDEWHNALEHFNYHCAYCLTGSAECQEHVVPVDKGGTYTAENIVPACLRCNSSKGNRTLKFWWKQQPFFKQESLDKVEKWLESRKSLKNSKE